MSEIIIITLIIVIIILKIVVVIIILTISILLIIVILSITVIFSRVRNAERNTIPHDPECAKSGVDVQPYASSKTTLIPTARRNIH